MKRIKLLSISFISTLLGLSFIIPHQSFSRAIAEDKTIDMYLIAGQSNAAGYSSEDATGDFEVETFNNVKYAAGVNYKLEYHIYEVNNFSDASRFKNNVTKGYGKDERCIGPEYGIAKALDTKYTGSRKAFIFKTASGGTSLRDVSTSGSGSETYGNWYPRSLWPSGYEADPYHSADPTGALYTLFIDNFRTVYNELKEEGYEPSVKGLAWMQGCDDLGHDDEYESIINQFIKDIRGEIKVITGDAYMDKMPVVIGKIATTYGQYSGTYNPYVPSFNKMQERVAAANENVSTIETSDLLIHNATNTKCLGTDDWHFNLQDARTLGERFGEKLFSYNHLRKNFNVSHGDITYQYDEAGKLILSLVPELNYQLTSLSINGINVLKDVASDYTYTINTPKQTYPDGIDVIATFVPKPLYKITYQEFDDTMGSYIDRVFKVVQGEKLSVYTRLNSGYEIISVKYNDELMTYNETTGAYEITPTSDGKVTLEIKNNNNQRNHNATNLPLILGLSIGGGVLLLGGGGLLTFFILKKKRK